MWVVDGKNVILVALIPIGRRVLLLVEVQLVTVYSGAMMIQQKA